MKATVQIKLLPSPEQAEALSATLHACNQAANSASQVAFATGATHKFALQKRIYEHLKVEYGLSAQPTVRVIGKVADAYTTRASNLRAGNLGPPGSQRRKKATSGPVSFTQDSAQPFDNRCLSWQLDARTVSIWTVRGRMKQVPFTGSTDQLKTVAEHRRGESDLAYRDGMWFLHATCDIPEEPLNVNPEGFVGVDLGIVNIATTSDGHRHAGRGLNRHRRRMNQLRAKLQRKRTKSTKRGLKRVRRREARRARDVNHQISKQIVERAERTGRGIALEDLQGIRERVRQAKAQRAALHSWAFAQLRNFITYKARRAGVPVAVVDPAYSSQSCSECDHTSRRNRTAQARFVCLSCGVIMHADANASRNLAHRGEVAWNAGRLSAAPTPLP